MCILEWNHFIDRFKPYTLYYNIKDGTSIIMLMFIHYSTRTAVLYATYKVLTTRIYLFFMNLSELFVFFLF